MFICKDISKQFLVAVYWEDGLLLIVVKEVSANGLLREHTARGYSKSAAKELMEAMAEGQTDVAGVQLDALAATAIAGRIAEGLQRVRKESTASRIRPEFWN